MFLIPQELHIRCSLRHHMHSGWQEATTDPTDTEGKQLNLEFSAFIKFSLPYFFCLTIIFFPPLLYKNVSFSMLKARLGLQPLSCPSSGDRNVYFIETMESVNSQNVCEALSNPLNADHCCSLQWCLTITQQPLPSILMTTIVFVIILLLCFNDLNLWHVGVYLPFFRKTLQAPRGQQNLQTGGRRTSTITGDWFKIFQSHSLWWSRPSALQQKENFILFLKCCYYIQEICKGTLTENDQISEVPVQQHLLSKWHFNAESQICILIKNFL